MLNEEFWTLEGPGTAHTRVLGSRFSARAFPLEAGESIESALALSKKLYHDASHHCWASIERKDNDLVQTQSDAGEPKGTAGLPILQELRKAALENSGVIVTRWFGGTKLGTGGLVRAYAECAALAIQDATRVQRRTGLIVVVDADYDMQNIVFQLATKFFAKVEGGGEGDGTTIRVRLKRKQVDDFIVALRDQSAGKLIGNVGDVWTS